MKTVPLQQVPSQTLQTQLDGQNVTITLNYKTEQGLFADVMSNGVTLISSIIALDAVPLVPTEYLGFKGNLMFIDTQGNDDPTYVGLGSRFYLIYLSADEYALV